MSNRVRIRVAPRASRQIDAASDWWIKNRPDIPDLLQEEIESAFNLILSQPLVGSLASNTKIKGLRRIHLSRIRYYLYYRARRSNIDVLGFWHSSRGLDPF